MIEHVQFHLYNRREPGMQHKIYINPRYVASYQKYTDPGADDVTLIVMADGRNLVVDAPMFHVENAFEYWGRAHEQHR
jgi:hypothetical protein